MKERRSRRWGLILSIGIGAAVLMVVVIALIPRGSGGGDERPPSPPSVPPGSSAPSSPGATGDVVDPNVAKRGWVAEPITQDSDTYVRAALEATASFDSQKATRDEWLTWLGTWFTPSPLYDDQQDAMDQMAGYKAELAQSVVPPQSQWDDLANNDGRVTARVDGQIQYLDEPDAAHKHVRTATANVIMTYTQSGGDTGGEASYDQTVRVSVQVVCGGASIPTPDSAQRAGDCKVVRFFDTAVG